MKNTLKRRELLKRAAVTIAGASAQLPAFAISAPSAFPKQIALPALPFAYDALEPFIDAKTMWLNHRVHHFEDVRLANRAIKDLARERLSNAAELDSARALELRRHLAGHAWHSLFWSNLNAPGLPPGEVLTHSLSEKFGTLENFRSRFEAAAHSIEGSGWAVLTLDSASGDMQVEAHDGAELSRQPQSHPLLVLDMWEHAYYLKHGHAVENYTANFWSVVNWCTVSRRLQNALVYGAGTSPSLFPNHFQGC